MLLFTSWQVDWLGSAGSLSSQRQLMPDAPARIIKKRVGQASCDGLQQQRTAQGWSSPNLAEETHLDALGGAGTSTSQPIRCGRSS